MFPRIEVRLGPARDGLAPSLFVWVERGVERRPRRGGDAARRRRVPLRRGPFAASPGFGEGLIEVSDGDVDSPDLAVSGRLPDIVHLATAPNVLGIPNPARIDGLGAILRLSRGKVTIDGDRRLALRLIRLLAL